MKHGHRFRQAAPPSEANTRRTILDKDTLTRKESQTKGLENTCAVSSCSANAGSEANRPPCMKDMRRPIQEHGYVIALGFPVQEHLGVGHKTAHGALNAQVDGGVLNINGSSSFT